MRKPIFEKSRVDCMLCESRVKCNDLYPNWIKVTLAECRAVQSSDVVEIKFCSKCNCEIGVGQEEWHKAQGHTISSVETVKGDKKQ